MHKIMICSALLSCKIPSAPMAAPLLCHGDRAYLTLACFCSKMNETAYPEGMQAACILSVELVLLLFTTDRSRHSHAGHAQFMQSSARSC